MARPDKAAAVAELADEFRNSNAAVLTEYRGLSVKQLQELRRALGENASYAVVKNTLTKIAAKEAGVDAFDELLAGPSAIAFVKGDPVEAAKSLRDFAKAHSPLVIKGGILDGKPLTADEISKIADLESREVLLGKLAGAMLASLQTAVSLFNAPLSQVARLAGALQVKAEQDASILGGEAGEPDAPSNETVDDTAAAGEVTDEASALGVTDEPPASDDAAEAPTSDNADEPAAAEASSDVTPDAATDVEASAEETTEG
jgi:large subunit ribosomal protein L10